MRSWNCRRKTTRPGRLPGWTPTTTSSRFQLVSQVACLDANSGCSRWGDRWSLFRRRSPSFAPVVVVVDLAAPSQRAMRSRSLLRSLPIGPCLLLCLFRCLLSAFARSSLVFSPSFPPPSATCAPCHLPLHALPSLSSSLRTERSSPRLHPCGVLRKFRFSASRTPRGC